jgi:arylsulfatase A-like enzyme
MKKIGFGCVLMIVLVSCVQSEPPPEPEAAGPPPNVILILVDALRADRLGAYGFDERPTSPNLDEFAARSAVFERAISQDGWTVPSVASLFTGVYPRTHQVTEFIDPKNHREASGDEGELILMDALSPDHDTLAEQFQRAGYHTAAILKSDVVNAGRGYEQGFEVFEFIAKKPKDRLESGAHLTDAVIEWLNGRAEDSPPFFAYVHYMDPHVSYVAPEPFYSKYTAGIDSELTGHYQEIVPFREGEKVPTEADIDKLLALYDAEVEYWDSQFGRLLRHIESMGLGENTIIAVTADHGEAFWEHEMFSHAGLFQENIHVPMIVGGPGVVAQRFSEWVQQMDLAPTLAELAGVPQGRHWVARSHAAAARGQGEIVEEVVYSEWAGERTIIEPSGLKLLTGHGKPRLYDLETDPHERINLADPEDPENHRPEDLARMTAELERIIAESEALAGAFSEAEQTELSEEQIEALKALGYLGD